MVYFLDENGYLRSLGKKRFPSYNFLCLNFAKGKYYTLALLDDTACSVSKQVLFGENTKGGAVTPATPSGSAPDSILQNPTKYLVEKLCMQFPQIRNKPHEVKICIALK